MVSKWVSFLGAKVGYKCRRNGAIYLFQYLITSKLRNGKNTGCGEREYPGVYSQVNVAADWIDEQICLHSCYPPDSCDPDIIHPCARAVAQGGTGATMEEGDMEFTITVTMDTYPSEFGLILMHEETQTEMWYIGYNSWQDEESPIDNPLVIQETFRNLTGGIYHLVSKVSFLSEK